MSPMRCSTYDLHFHNILLAYQKNRTNHPYASSMMTTMDQNVFRYNVIFHDVFSCCRNIEISKEVAHILFYTLASPNPWLSPPHETDNPPIQYNHKDKPEYCGRIPLPVCLYDSKEYQQCPKTIMMNRAAFWLLSAPHPYWYIISDQHDYCTSSSNHWRNHLYKQ